MKRFSSRPKLNAAFKLAQPLPVLRPPFLDRLPVPPLKAAGAPRMGELGALIRAGDTNGGVAAVGWRE